MSVFFNYGFSFTSLLKKFRVRSPQFFLRKSHFKILSQVQIPTSPLQVFQSLSLPLYIFIIPIYSKYVVVEYYTVHVAFLERTNEYDYMIISKVISQNEVQRAKYR